MARLEKFGGPFSFALGKPAFDVAFLMQRQKRGQP